MQPLKIAIDKHWHEKTETVNTWKAVALFKGSNTFLETENAFSKVLIK